MSKTLTITKENFSRGLVLLQDDSQAPFGSARKMLNCMITDRGGIAPRPGTKLLGTHNTSTSAIRGLYNFKKSKDQPDILLKSYDTYMQFLHPTQKEWAILESGYTADKEFGFTSSMVNEEAEDFTYFCNRYEELSRWNGSYALINEALTTGLETVIKVDSLLTDDIFYTDTATSNSATTLTVSTANYAVDGWKDFYIYIPSTGKVRLITSNTATEITFSTLGSGPGNVVFQIRQLKFPLSDSVIYNGSKISYTTIDVYNQLPVTTPHTCPINTPVALVLEVLPNGPRGNRMDTLRRRLYVSNIRSALSRDSSGDIHGTTQSGAIFISKINDPKDFSFAATRVAGEGAMICLPYGGGGCTDIKGFEDEVAVYKNDYIELIKFTEDVNDAALETPLKTGTGSIARVIKGSDDHYFMRPDGVYTSLGRVKQKDITPQTENLGISIKRLLDTYNNDNFTGIEFNNRIISAHKSSDSVDDNDVMLIYNKKNKSFEGIWNIGANNFDTFKENGEVSSELVYGESNGANVWKMFQDRKADVRDSSTELPYTAEWVDNFFNVLPIKQNIQAINSIALEGYISPDTTFTFKLYKDFETDSFLSFDFSGTETDLIQGTNDIGRFFSSHPFATTPIGSISEAGSDGRRRFSFIAYFPYKYCQYLSSGLSSTGVGQDWEIIRIGYGLKESVSTKVSNIKTL